ncbi:MAG: hypothetical protein ACRD2C_15215 [Acidimicrobiales bacterium]
MAPAQRTATALRAPRPSEADRSTERLRRLRVVGARERRARTFRLTPRAGVTMTVALFGGLFAVAGSHALLIESQGRLDRLDDQVAEEEARYESLRMEVADMAAPERILAEAAELGMVAPEDRAWVSPDQPVSDSGSSGEAAEGSTHDDPTTTWEDIKPHLGSTP